MGGGTKFRLQTGGQGGSNIPPQTKFRGGIIMVVQSLNPILFLFGPYRNNTRYIIIKRSIVHNSKH